MKKIFILLIAILIFNACKKQNEWLDVKSNKADVVPISLEDFQALLDNESIINYGYPSLAVISSDNYYNNDDIALNGGAASERNAYRWLSDIYEGTISTSSDWSYPYRIVSYCNVALKGLEAINTTPSNISDYNNVKGNALFHRAFAYFNLLTSYAKPYDKTTAGSNLGVPLKLEPDINEMVSRQSVEQCYNQVLTDLKTAAGLLPENPQFKTRAGKTAVYALLAKVYLTMDDYANALQYSKLALGLNDKLLNYNTISPAPTYPFPTYQTGNVEVIYYALTGSYAAISIANLNVDDNLYNFYNANDLRKTLFFGSNANGTKTFRGRYTGIANLFSGLATNELYLIKAECEARLGNFGDSMNTLNALLITRWATNTFIPFNASSETEALNIILTERRKEIPFTGLIRWQDLRRLNKDVRFARTLTRTIAGQTYTLAPNDKRYVLPIPPIETTITGLEQNER
jgi:tetratricopeptide (TPR) repeat protein